MRIAVIAFALTLGPAALAHELDSEVTVSAKQIELAKDLPQTAVIRVSKADPSKIEVVHLKEHLQPGTKVSFEQLAMSSETTKLALNSKNELDAVSSTSSWSFGYAQGPRGGSAGYVRGPYGGAGYARGPNGGVVAGGYRGYGGYGRGYYGGYGNYYGNNNYYGYGNNYYRPYYGNYQPYNYGYGYNGCQNQYNNCGYYGSQVVYASAWAYPTYSYAGYNYNYAPYYGYSDNSYNYSYSNCVY